MKTYMADRGPESHEYFFEMKEAPKDYQDYV